MLTVALFTIREMVKRKSFIISNLIILLIIVIGFNVPNILKTFGNSEKSGKQMLIVDSENAFEGSLATLNEMELGYEFEISEEAISFEQIKERIEKEEIEEALVISKENGSLKMEYIVDNLLYVEAVPEKLVSAMSTIYSNLQVSKLNLTPEELEAISPNFDFKLTQIEEQEVEGNPVVMMLLSLVLFFAIYYTAFQVSSSITTEKTSKIIETLVTSTKPSTIVLGKTIGVGLVGLAQIFVMLIVAILSAKFFLEPGILEGLINIENMTPALFAVTLIYFILGYFTYAFLYALTGSTVRSPEDVQSANGPVAILVVISFYLSYFTMMNPTSELNSFAAIFPFSSPFCMPLRMMLGLAGVWDTLISIAVLLVTIFIIAKVSIKIYSSAILNYGTKMNFKDIVRIYKEK